jgi:hypothetical protein
MKSNAKGTCTKALYHIRITSATQISQKSTILHFAHSLALFFAASGDIAKVVCIFLVNLPVTDKNRIQLDKP